MTVKSKQYVEDLKRKSATELQDELVAAKKELFNLRLYIANIIYPYPLFYKYNITDYNCIVHFIKI